MNAFTRAFTQFLSLIIPTKKRNVYRPQFDDRSNLDPDIDTVVSAVQSCEGGNWRPFCMMVKQMMTDGHIMTELSKRKLAVLGDPLSFKPASKAAVDVAAAAFCERWADDYDGFTDAMLWALDGTIWPRVAMAKRFSQGKARRFDLELDPIDPALFNYTNGDFRVEKAGEDGSPSGTPEFVDPAEIWSYRGHLSTLSDQRGGPARPLLFWHFMSHCSWNWWGRFLERFGAPFMVGRVDNMDSDDTYLLENAFAQATRLFGVVVSKNTEIEMLEGRASDGSKAYESMHRMAQEEKSKIILGSSASTQGVKSNLNGSSAETMDKVRGEYRAWDSFRLGTDLRAKVLKPLMFANGIPGRPPLPAWGDLAAAGNDVAGEFLVQLKEVGIIPADEALDPLSQIAGIPLRWAPAPASPPVRDPSAEILRTLSADPFPWPLLRQS